MQNSSIRLVSSRSASMSCRAGFAYVLLLLLCSGAVRAQISQDEPALAPPRLKASPTLEPPPLKPPLKPPQETTTIVTPQREAIFLRADKLEGEGQSWIEAQGNVELRSRRQTVLADWLRYDQPTDEFW